MNHAIRITAVCALILSGASAISQNHYIVEVDRINETRQYKQMRFVKGRPAESDIPDAPVVRKGDILTIRMVNFNELIYGFDMVEKLVERPSTNLAAQILKNNPMMDFLKMNPAVSFLTRLATDPPGALMSSSAEGGRTVQSLRKQYQGVLRTIVSAQDVENIVFDEGETLDNIREKIDELAAGHDPAALAAELKRIRKELASLPAAATGTEAKLMAEEIDELLATEDRGFLAVDLKVLRKLLENTDFMVERTMIIGDRAGADWSARDDYEKYMAWLFIYKRAVPVTDPKENLVRPYDYRDGQRDGDFIRQSMVVDLKVQYPKRPYWTIGALNVFVPTDAYTYVVEGNADWSDSLRFKSVYAGGSRFAIGTDIHFDLSTRARVFTPAASLGIAVAIGNGKNSRSITDITFTRTFITTGIGGSFVKYPFLSLKAGIAWSRYERLSEKYRADTWYPRNLSAAEIDNAVTRHIRPAFYLGIGIKL